MGIFDAASNRTMCRHCVMTKLIGISNNKQVCFLIYTYHRGVAERK